MSLLPLSIYLDDLVVTLLRLQRLVIESATAGAANLSVGLLTPMPTNPVDLELDILPNCFSTKSVDSSCSVNKVFLLTFSLTRVFQICHHVNR